jgi:hypothetical protein
MRMHAAQFERRSGMDRRNRSLKAYWHGAWHPRRHAGRRAVDSYPIVDWHPARVFACVFAILLLCVCDGVLTVFLISRGAVEVNPFMALFVPHALGWFAAIKLSFTSAGAMVLVACSRMKLFRSIPGELFLVALLLTYLALVVYELRLVEQGH